MTLQFIELLAQTLVVVLMGLSIVASLVSATERKWLDMGVCMAAAVMGYAILVEIKVAPWPHYLSF